MTITENTLSSLRRRRPRGVFLRAWAVATEVAGAVRPDQGPPVALQEFDAATVRAHLLSVETTGRRPVAGGPFSVGEGVDVVPGDDWHTAFAAAGTDVVAGRRRLLERTFTLLPWAEAPGRASRHVRQRGRGARLGPRPSDRPGADLGTTTSPPVSPPSRPASRRGAHRGLRRQGQHARRHRGLVHPSLRRSPVDDDATPIDRLVAWSGRDPHWSPSA